MLVRSFFVDVFLDASATGAEGVSCVKDVDDNITGVNDLIQLVPDSLALALGEDGLTSGSQVAVCCRLCELVAIAVSNGVSAQQMGLLQAIEVGVVHLLSLTSKVLERADGKLGPLPLSLWAKGLGERRALDSNLGLVLLDAVLGILIVLDQGHGKLVLLEQVRVWVGLLLGNGTSEGGESILRDDTGIGKPLAVWLNAGRRLVPRLIRGGLCDVATGIALRLAVLEHVERFDLLGVSTGHCQLMFSYTHATGHVVAGRTYL